MPHAHRQLLPGVVGHMTRRCHNKKLLLTFDKDIIIRVIVGLKSWDRATTVSQRQD